MPTIVYGVKDIARQPVPWPRSSETPAGRRGRHGLVETASSDFGRAILSF